MGMTKSKKRRRDGGAEEEGQAAIDDRGQQRGMSATNEQEEPHAEPNKAKKKIRKLSLKATEDFNEKLRRRGVLYVARIPPRMTPSKIKTLLSDFGTVTRVYLAEEDKTVRKRRKKAGGSGAKRYVEGWVEFEDKNVAKRVGEMLNNTPISTHKRSVHYDDLWNVKYLRKFQWSYLTERVAYERRVREQKLRVEMAAARRENASYVALVEAGKKLDRIEERRSRKKAQKEEGKRRERGGESAGGGVVAGHAARKFRQTRPMEGGSEGAAKRAVLGSLV